MERYKNLSGNSGITAYSITPGSISVEFNHNTIYRYTHSSAGKHILEKMKKLASSGKGLSTYISRTVRNKFDKQLK